MRNQDLIYELQDKIQEIYECNQLISLTGKNNSYKLNGKPILSWHNEVTRHRNCHFDQEQFYNYDKNIDELLFISDEIVYFLAHLYLYKPYINTPIKNAYFTGKNMIYPVFISLETKRYFMYINILFEKLYNYWDRIGDLIASFYPYMFNRNVYFGQTLNKLSKKFKDNEDFKWLLNFKDNQYKEFNEKRIKTVHYHSQITDSKWNQLKNVMNYQEAMKTSEYINSFPEYFKKLHELTKKGFEKTLNLLEAINKFEKYNCG